MAKKKDVAGDGAYVSDRVRIVYGELVDSLAHGAVLAEQSSELLKSRVAELKSECANMPAERLLEEFAMTQATLEIQHLSYEHLKQSLYKTAQGLGLLNIVGEQAISEHASGRATRGHAETRDAKDSIFKWCDEHHHKYPRNMDGMASEAMKVEPYKWRTVRGWITEWKKDRKLVFKWCDEHHHKYSRNMDGMATAITESKPLLVKQKWDTVRGWITEWAKDRKLRSASKPDSN